MSNMPQSVSKPPTVNDVRPFIGAKDFDGSRDFYIALGWQLIYDSESLRVLDLAGHRFYLQNYYSKEWCENTMLHVSVDNVDAWWSHANDVFSRNALPDARISDAIKDEGYARVFHIWDPAGVLLHIAQFKED